MFCLWLETCINRLLFVNALRRFFRMMLGEAFRTKRLIWVLVKYKSSNFEAGCLCMPIWLTALIFWIKGLIHLLVALSQVFEPVFVEILIDSDLLLGTLEVRSLLDWLIWGWRKVRWAETASTVVLIDLRLLLLLLLLEIQTLLDWFFVMLRHTILFRSWPRGFVAHHKLCMLLACVQYLVLFLLL